MTMAPVSPIDRIAAAAFESLRNAKQFFECFVHLGFATGPFPIYVEKILAQHERLPPWPVEGTTGYEFLALVNRLFVDPDGEAAIDDAYRRFGGEAPPFERIALDCRHQITDTLLQVGAVLMAEDELIGRYHFGNLKLNPTFDRDHFAADRLK